MGVTSFGRHIRPACTQGFTRSLKLCKQCRFNSCVRVFFIPMGSRGQTQWVVTSISHMGEMRDSDWSRPNLLRSDWLPIHVAPMTTSSDFLVSEPMIINIQNRQHIRLFSPFNSVRAAFLKSCLCFLCLYGACVCCHPNLHFSVSVFVTFS